LLITSALTSLELKFYHEAFRKGYASKHGVCFVDFACSGPYVEINMHLKIQKVILTLFSLHTLGGPGTGVLVFNKICIK
jgi:selenocysteine lyase/cysteine desulfurase